MWYYSGRRIGQTQTDEINRLEILLVPVGRHHYTPNRKSAILGFAEDIVPQCLVEHHSRACINCNKYILQHGEREKGGEQITIE